MEIYLMRHGIAEEGGTGQPDSTRRLTPEGRDRTADVLNLAGQTGVRPDLILSSPYIRAMETARIAQEELSVREPIVDFPAIVPFGNPESVWNELRDYAQYRALLLTSHEPLVGQLAAYLLNAPSLRIDVKKASIIRIDFASMTASPHGILRWMMVPAMVD